MFAFIVLYGICCVVHIVWGGVVFAAWYVLSSGVYRIAFVIRLVSNVAYCFCAFCFVLYFIGIACKVCNVWSLGYGIYCT